MPAPFTTTAATVGYSATALGMAGRWGERGLEAFGPGTTGPALAAPGASAGPRSQAHPGQEPAAGPRDTVAAPDTRATVEHSMNRMNRLWHSGFKARLTP